MLFIGQALIQNQIDTNTNIHTISNSSNDAVINILSVISFEPYALCFTPFFTRCALSLTLGLFHYFLPEFGDPFDPHEFALFNRCFTGR